MAYCPPAQRRRQPVREARPSEREALRVAREYREKLAAFKSMLERSGQSASDFCCEDCYLGGLPSLVWDFVGLAEWVYDGAPLPRKLIYTP